MTAKAPILTFWSIPVQNIMGAKRKPTAVKIAEGHRGHRPLDITREPQPSLGVLDMPEGLGEWGQKQWKLITEELDRMNVIATVDHGAMEAAIRGGDAAIRADKQIAKFQAKIEAEQETREDWYHLSVANNVSKKGWTQFRGFATEFGLTPASRSRITVEGSTPMGRKGSTAPRGDSIEDVLSTGPLQ